MEWLQPWSRPPSQEIANTPLALLPTLTRSSHRSIFNHALATRSASPMLLAALPLPYLVLAAAIAVPRAHRQLRWPALASIWAIAAYNIVYVSSLNLSFAFIGGVAQAFLAMRAWTLLVGLDVHEEVARVVRRRAKSPGVEKGKPDGDTGGVDGSTRQRKPVEMEKTAEYEYVWQFYPAEESLLQRLGWAADLIFSLRGAGHVVDIDAIPRVSRSGYKRSLTPADFLRDRLSSFLSTYLLLDLIGVAMSGDPYFVLGPDALSSYHGGLPPHLEAMPPIVRYVVRHAAAAAGVYGAISIMFALIDIVQYLLMEGLFPSKGGVWYYASTFGSFELILDRGLPGCWGSFWHQTFRMTFLSPVTYLLKRGYLKKGSVAADAAALLVSFFMSGVMHASGSVSSAPLTKPWRSVAFFMLQPVGIAIQLAITSGVGRLFTSRGPPSRQRVLVRRAFHFVFAFTWLFSTGRFFVDDVSSAGLWLCEPVPISVVRALGFGSAEDPYWWRWDRDAFPRYVAGEHWWQSGWAA